MKYGEELRERSIPQWMPYNVDYNELKHLIKVNTTRDQGQAITIPGASDGTLQKFEGRFYNELCSQHDRVGLFVKSKADEYRRILNEYQKRLQSLLARCDVEQGGRMTIKRREKLSRLETKVLRCGHDIRNLEHFVSCQRQAFRKILKKYKKWTGSSSLGTRFTEEVLNSPKSFTHHDFNQVNAEYNRLLAIMREAAPLQSGSSTPTVRSRSDAGSVDRYAADALFTQGHGQQRYWNEYDNGSEADDDNEPYTIYIDPTADSFLGSNAAMHVFSSLSSRAKDRMEKIRGWLSPNSSAGERRPLIERTNNDYFTTHPNSIFATDTEAEDDLESADFPPGYLTHYAKFASVPDQKLSQYKERLMLIGTIASFFAAFVLILIAGLLVATGRHRLRVEVDVGATIGVVSSLFFATLGVSIMLCRWQTCGWVHRIIVAVTFIATCALNGMILVVVMGNTAV